jgi:hypothetical protein
MQALKVLVVLMGVVIAAIVGIIIITVIQRVGPSSEDELAESAAAGFGEIDLPVPPGCELAAAELTGGRLVLRLQGPAESGCQQAVLLDPDSGRVLGRVTLAPSP